MFLNRDREEEARREQKEVRKDRKIERETQASAQQPARILALIHPATMPESQGEQGRKNTLTIHRGWAAPRVPTAERMGAGEGSVHIAPREGVRRPLHLLPLCEFWATGTDGAQQLEKPPQTVRSRSLLSTLG